MSTSPISIPATSTIGEARRMMMHLGLRHLLVVDDKGRLIGLLGDRALSSAPDAGAAISTVMTRHPLTADPDDELGAIARVMTDRSLGAMPVIDRAGALVGIVSYLDVLRRMAAEHRRID